LPDSPLPELPPRCACGSLLRPDVVWFGESLPEGVLRLAWQVAAQCDLFLLIGTSATVQPAASLAWVAKDNGAFMIEINPEATAASEIADESFRAKSGIILPELVKAIETAE
jgi:NAD-dependent protein deacetylases, SIR2 family